MKRRSPLLPKDEANLLGSESIGGLFASGQSTDVSALEGSKGLGSPPPTAKDLDGVDQALFPGVEQQTALPQYLSLECQPFSSPPRYKWPTHASIMRHADSAPHSRRNSTGQSSTQAHPSHVHSGILKAMIQHPTRAMPFVAPCPDRRFTRRPFGWPSANILQCQMQAKRTDLSVLDKLPFAGGGTRLMYPPKAARPGVVQGGLLEGVCDVRRSVDSLSANPQLPRCRSAPVRGVLCDLTLGRCPTPLY